MMTPDVAETSGEQAYAEIPMVRPRADDGNEQGDGTLMLDSLLHVFLQPTVFATHKVESQSENQIPFLIYLPSLIKVLKVKHQ